MKHHSPPAFVLLSILAVVLAVSLLGSTGKHVALADDPTPGSNLPTPQEGSGTKGTQEAPEVKFDAKNVGAPPTLKDLKAKYPTLGAYLEKIDNMDDPQKDLDFKELYSVIALIYKDFGAAGVGVFLEETNLVWELTVPLAYFDLFGVFEDGGMDKVFTQAKAWHLLNDKGELIGYIAIDPLEKLDSVKAELTKLGVSIYDFDKEEWILEIGIPKQLITKMETPDVVMKFLTDIGNLDGVDDFIAPDLPSTKAAK